MKIKKIFIFLIAILCLLPTYSFAQKDNLTNKYFSSLAELENYISKANNRHPIVDSGISVEDVNSDHKVSAESSSNTNVQVEGVDEGDIVKTQDQYIYYAHNDTFYIINTHKEKSEIDSKVNLKDNYIQELYVEDNNLIIISSSNLEGKSYTKAYIYSLNNKKLPKLKRELSLEGYLVTSRVKDSTLYLVTNQQIYNLIPTPIPRVSDSANQSITEIDYKKISYCPVISPNSYTNIMAIPIDVESNIQLESLLGNNNQAYMSFDNLYLGNYDYNTKQTIITKYNTTDANLKIVASALLKGSILNQFSMDEYEGNFRVATTLQTWSSDGFQSSNYIFVLDKKMNIIGKIEDIAPNERIYSVRFDNDKGYVVTFREVDPLFTIDFSNPTAPTILGELKVPGYSSYMHNISDDLLLGIGRDIQNLYIKNHLGTEILVGTRDGGIKFSLFDVSNPLHPVEKDMLILGGNGSYSEILYNHKALMVNPENTNFGFIGILQGDNPNSPSFKGGLIVDVSNEQLSLRGNFPIDDSFDIYQSRMLYINNKVFIITPQGLTSYDYNTLNQIEKINF